MIEIGNVIDTIRLFNKMYDFARMIDPITKKVYELRGEQLVKLDTPCYKFWGKEGVCDNCISTRAWNENDSLFKLQKKDNAVFLITTVPIVINEKTFIVQFIKDATNSLYFQEGKSNTQVKVLEAIECVSRAMVKDRLTGVYNRRFIDERLPRELSNISLHNEYLSLIFLDIDFFKKINDTYGHLIGDQVLREFSKELKKHIRNKKDWIARYGGEEFLICLPNTSLSCAKAVAERIRRCMMDKVFIIEDKKIQLTSSLGVHAVSSRDKNMTPEKLLKITDKKLYVAKAQGRNRIF